MSVYQDYTDAQLVALLQDSDARAFETIYRRYASALFRYACQNISDRRECQEIIQDVFESLWQRRSTASIRNLRPYLYNIVRYLMVRYFRKERQQQRYAQHYLLFEAALDNLPEEDWTPEKIRDWMLGNLDGLTERAKTAFRLRLLENLSNGEIAERMQISKLTVESYIVKVFNHFRALGDIRKAGDH